METFRHRVYNLIRDDDDNNLASTIFDCTIILLIVLNVVLVILDTFRGQPEWLLSTSRYIEVGSVIVFSIEYIARVWTADYIYPQHKKYVARLKYAFSFMAVVDFLAIIPFYLPFFFPIDLRVLRAIRLFRLLRVLKVNRYTHALSIVGGVIRRKSAQLISSMLVVLMLMVIASVLMYNIEYDAQPDVFENALSGLWWAIATLTTVGYGDIYPVTAMGKLLSSVIALLGIGFVAIPTGIISAGFMEGVQTDGDAPAEEKHYCPHCGKRLD